MELLTIPELAAYLKVKKSTVYNWLNEGKIPGIKVNGVWRFKKETIDKWLESKQRIALTK